MTRDEKNQLIDNLAQQISESKHFYLTNIEALNAEQSSFLRRKCFEKGVKLIVAKNTLLKKALDKLEGNYEDLYPVLKENTSVMLSDTGNIPAKLIKEIRKDWEKPLLQRTHL